MSFILHIHLRYFCIQYNFDLTGNLSYAIVFYNHKYGAAVIESRHWVAYTILARLINDTIFPVQRRYKNGLGISSFSWSV
jgi:hypothetical protein